MNALALVRSRLNVAYALIVVVLGALALTALSVTLPGAIPGFELLLFAGLGVALGRLVHFSSDKADSGREGDAVARSDRLDALLHSIARLLQAQVKANDAYRERLDGANSRLSQHSGAGPVRDIVLALVEDNRQMRDKLTALRNELEESRLHTLQLRNSLERSEEAGHRDVVTLIGNRRYFDATFAEELERARRTGEDFCLALADLDRFKLVNDRFGHLVGDRLLRLFAEILVQNIRGQDRVARFGGEEFALMLPGASLEEAILALERIRKILESKQWTLGPTGEPVGTVTASFGVAKLLADETGVELIKRADERLYSAKAKGRNCVVADAPATSEPPRSAPAPRPKRVAHG
jgi:diguanylate cyclase